jgi:two-component system, NtrC family, sensor histidine kinase PilS
LNVRGFPTKKKESLFSKIQWLMFYRAVVVTILLGATVLVQLKDTHFFRYSSLHYFYILIAITYSLTLVYSLLLPRVRNLRVFAYVQIFGDVFFVTLLIYFTGGSESIFSWVYILSIFSASIILYRRGGLILASAASILYGTILDLEFYSVIRPMGSHIAAAGGYQSSYVLYLIAVNMTAFYLVAFLSAYLSEQVRRKEEELKETLVDYGQLERLYRDIVQNVNSGLITVDNAGRITSLNRMAGEITGYRLEDIYQQGIGDLFPGFLSGSPSRGDGAARGWQKPGRLSRWEADFQTGTGAKLRLGFSVSPLKDSREEEVGSIIIFQDLTKLREMEEDLKRADRLAAIGSMAAGMAHEIRNPLASISGSIEILKEELGNSPEHQQLMEIILREVGRLNSLIGDFLLYARPAPRAEGTIHLNGAIEDILKVFAQSPNCGPGIRIVTLFHDDLTVPGDARQMRQVFWNLFNNAAEAMPGGGELRVELRRLPAPLPVTDHPNPCEVSVTDTGAGIAEDVIGKIFDPFFTTKDKGTGLGLSIVHSILSTHGAKIQVQSRLGQGTTFTLFFPATP